MVDSSFTIIHPSSSKSVRIHSQSSTWYQDECKVVSSLNGNQIPSVVDGSGFLNIREKNGCNSAFSFSEWGTI